MNAIRFIIRSILYIPFIILRAIAQGLWSVIHGILTSVGRWIGRVVLPIVGLCGMLWFLTNNMTPDQLGGMLAPIAGIAITAYVMRNMFNALLPPPKKRKRR